GLTFKGNGSKDKLTPARLHTGRLGLTFKGNGSKDKLTPARLHTGRLGLTFKAAALERRKGAASVLTADASTAANRHRLKEIFKGIMQVAAKIYAQVIFFDRRSLCA
ncbi:MAG: hypothetical protein IJU71_09150, partial [Selenomonadaceae bacterium]|nr:hypothetical protein [Selenomonadaceae bacterium]